MVLPVPRNYETEAESPTSTNQTAAALAPEDSDHVLNTGKNTEVTPIARFLLERGLQLEVPFRDLGICGCNHTSTLSRTRGLGASGSDRGCAVGL